MSVLTSPVFHLLDQHGQHHIGSLIDVLQNDKYIRFDYPIALMNPLAHHLVTGLIESVLHYNEVPISKENWKKMVWGEAWPEPLIEAMNNSPSGLELFTDTAFMQLPGQVFKASEHHQSIMKLLQPYILAGETTKGLRCISEPIKKLCPACVLIGLYTRHYFTAAIAQYWSTAQSNGGLLLVIDAPSLPLRAALAQNLLHSEYREIAAQRGYLENQHWQRFPWDPGQDGNHGLNSDDSIPLESWLNPAEQRGSIEDYYLPMMRGIRLLEQDSQPGDYCDLCGCICRQNTVTNFLLKGENSLFKEDLQEKSKKQLNGKLDFKLLYRQTSLRHPSLTYHHNSQKDEWYREVAPALATNVKSRRPVWANFLTVSQEARPLLLQQWESEKKTDNQIETLVMENLVLRLAGISYKKGQDADAVTLASYGYAQFSGMFSELAEQDSLCKKVIQVTDQVVNALVKAVKNMEKSVVPTETGKPYKLEKAKKGEQGTLSSAPTWLNIVDQVWNETLAELLRLVKMNRSQRKEELEISVCRIRNMGEELLKQWLNNQGSTETELKARFQENQCLGTYRNNSKG